MKSFIVLIAFALMCSTAGFSQKLSDDKVPANVKSAFKEKFPKVTAVTWEMEDQKEYEASFKMDNADYTASFDLKGKWLETENKVDITSLPKAVTESIAKQFAGFTIKVAEQTVTEKSKSYELKLVKGDEKKSVEISEKGIIVNKETEQEKKSN